MGTKVGTADINKEDTTGIKKEDTASIKEEVMGTKVDTTGIIKERFMVALGIDEIDVESYSM
jgi:hypothetical protein